MVFRLPRLREFPLRLCFLSGILIKTLHDGLMKWFFGLVLVALAVAMVYLVASMVRGPEPDQVAGDMVLEEELVAVEESSPTGPAPSGEAFDEPVDPEHVPAREPEPMEIVPEVEAAAQPEADWAARAQEAVARVDGKEITRLDLDQALTIALAEQQLTPDDIPSEYLSFFQQQALQQLILDVLISEAAGQIEVEEALVDQQLEELIAQFGTREVLEAELAQVGIELEEIREQIRESLRMQAWMEEQLGEDFGDEEIERAARSFYDENPDQFQIPETVRARHILLRVDEGADSEEAAALRERIEELAGQIEEGADFAELAREHSEDPGSAPMGGDLNYFPAEAMDPAFAEAAFALDIDEVSEPVRSRFGWHLIEVTSRQDARMLDWDEIRESVMEFIGQQQRQEIMGETMQELLDNAEIEILDPTLDVAPVALPGMEPGTEPAPTEIEVEELQLP